MSAPAEKSFHIVDYILFIGVLLVSIAIGLYHAFTGGKQRTTKEYFTGNRRLRTVPVALSILVSFVSAILVLGIPAEVYTRGAQLTIRTLGYCVACVISSIFLVPLFFAIKVTSSFEYLERRYGSKLVRLMGTISMLMGNIFYMGLVMYAPSTSLQAVTGLPLWITVLSCGSVCTVYTALGGMKGVVWTDVFQSLIMVGGMLAIIVQGAMHVGGIGKVWQLNQEGERLVFFNFNPDPTERLSFWSLVIGGTFHTLCIFGIGQTSVQRYCSLPTVAQARRSVFLNVPGLLLLNILALLVGMVVYAYYASIQCDPLQTAAISNSNQLVPYFVVDVLNYPGLPGLFVAVLFCGALSSMSSSLNAASAVTWEDILKYFFRNFKEAQKAQVTKLLVLFYGGLAVLMSFITDRLGDHVLYASLSFTGATSGPSLGMFLMGAFCPFANAWGALSGFLVSTAFLLWVSLGAFITRPYGGPLATSADGCYGNTSLFTSYNTSVFTTVASPTVEMVEKIELEEPSAIQNLYKISFLWYSAIGVCLTFFIGVIVSLLTGRTRGREVDQSLLVPFRQRLVDWLPVCLGGPKSSTASETDSEVTDKELDDLSCPLKQTAIGADLENGTAAACNHNTTNSEHGEKDQASHKNMECTNRFLEKVQNGDFAARTSPLDL